MLHVDYVLTLHDIDFVATAHDISDDEREDRHEFVRTAARRTVPSRYIGTLLSDVVGNSQSFEFIANGVDCRSENTDRNFRLPDDRPFDVAVVGALGLHKGLKFLCEVVDALPNDVRVVVLGYVDGQLLPGWQIEDRLWVHGAFEPASLPTLVNAYGCRLALFPNRTPESYCYALSDAWCAGLPALGPGAGALGERVVETGAGWIFAPDAVPCDVAAMISSCLRDARQLASAVSRAVHQLTSCNEMVAALNQQYGQVSKGGSVAPDLLALQPLAAAQLNGRLFRAELQRLAGDLAFAQRQLADNDAAQRSLVREYEGRGEWIATLQTHVHELKAEIARLEAARLTERAEHARVAEKLACDVSDTIAVARSYQDEARRYELAMAVLPPIVRRMMRDRADRLFALEKKP